MRSLAATISLNVSAILPSMPTPSPGMRTEKSPTRMACSATSRACGEKACAPLRFSCAGEPAPLLVGPRPSVTDMTFSNSGRPYGLTEFAPPEKPTHEKSMWRGRGGRGARASACWMFRAELSRHAEDERRSILELPPKWSACHAPWRALANHTTAWRCNSLRAFGFHSGRKIFAADALQHSTHLTGQPFRQGRNNGSLGIYL